MWSILDVGDHVIRAAKVMAPGGSCSPTASHVRALCHCLFVVVEHPRVRRHRVTEVLKRLVTGVVAHHRATTPELAMGTRAGGP